MKQRASRRHLLLQWTFHRAGRFVTCQLTHDGPAYRLSLFTHSSRSATYVASYTSGIAAMQRHAEIAKALRNSGWTLASYTTDAVVAAHPVAA
jgi:hypothetical protein